MIAVYEAVLRELCPFDEALAGVLKLTREAAAAALSNLNRAGFERGQRHDITKLS